MGYEIYVKEFGNRSTAPTMTVSQKLGRCTLNRSAALLFDKDAVENILLLWDNDAKKMAIRPISKKDARAFSLRYARNKEKAVIGAAFSGVMFLRHIGFDFSTTGTFPIKWSADQAMFEVELPKERFHNSQQPLQAVEGGRKHGKAIAGD